jgi:hypothetical protein
VPASGSLSVEVRSFADMKLELLGGLRRKTMARSCPPVREAKWWMRSSVFGIVASCVQEGARRRTRSSRVASGFAVLVLSEARSGIARSWVSSLFSVGADLACDRKAVGATHLEASDRWSRPVRVVRRRKKGAS